jgi:hypothetical protein
VTLPPLHACGRLLDRIRALLSEAMRGEPTRWNVVLTPPNARQAVDEPDPGERERHLSP